MFVKVCGLRTIDAVDAAVDAGADAVGFVFAPGSVRLIGADEAAPLVARVPDRVETVGVFRRQPIDEVLQLARASGVSTVQLHGDEPDEHFRRAVDAGFAVLRAVSATRYTEAGRDWRERLLIDATDPGSGVPFDPADLPVPPSAFWLLAGGLTPDNVGALAAAFAPSGVDVSSGVESAPGLKDPGRIRDFLAAART
ncbi:N-(5'-phosphoribosyl)anthranilate isomerase OS=Tsukamurella paurometabola (strain ATCC 8368 / DSM / CCUG 35730 / CIP 100753 / JCM 10117 / KCTC 9821 / NBRC 16120 / NCIMB 702349 / NCTC 13040) OX=521096 GN=trpF PE=3 SV=1 [Tsukamurella paurometabola]|uniref:N-(5'-phosphoribosyl)anthranilate isomerase n=1 Tax=Tsukamurella paurometabola (strain ATCC 8368 / DSM 20162 / CCUG 35730 / CIP 100753 / JCM 10117 / KCTC 9821 / NBRC 16120 / NCIMB 702349 / NCTC 13040) TaxID=521096 RepID=D5UMS2_TSUPD|nr:phosphoribosylanthranilate isomerase [Tsukamurella paurometabola]ADG80546.1 Phosphoribosylanthranilate isomerase [Tsukamurella paurometabola DSM 20162]SUP40044.1 N-(5'-phosphoribosyl)anthranilate isomerase [Tsukamurella paurometabola]